MSSLRVNGIQNLSGGRINQTIFTPVNNAIITGITWTNTLNNTTQSLGSITGATESSVTAIMVSLWYMHNGSTNHGYLTGTVFQTGKSSASGVYTWNSHYDWYYNIIEVPLIIPWDPAGTQSLSMLVADAFNTSSSNTYAFYHRGIISQA